MCLIWAIVNGNKHVSGEEAKTDEDKEIVFSTKEFAK